MKVIPRASVSEIKLSAWMGMKVRTHRDERVKFPIAFWRVGKLRKALATLATCRTQPERLRTELKQALAQLLRPARKIRKALVQAVQDNDRVQRPGRRPHGVKCP